MRTNAVEYSRRSEWHWIDRRLAASDEISEQLSRSDRCGDAEPLVTGRDPQSRSLFPRPDEGKLVRCCRTKAGPCSNCRRERQPRHEVERAVEHSAYDGSIDRRVPSNELARRADQHLARSPRLNVECYGFGRHRVRARQIPELDQLMPAEPGVTIRDDEMSLAWHDRNSGSELGYTRSRRIDHAVARDPLVPHDHLARADCVHANTLAQLCAVCGRALQQGPCAIRRVDDRITGHEQCSSEARPQMRFGFRELRWQQYLGRDSALRVNPLLRADCAELLIILGNPQRATRFVLDIAR